MKEKIPRMESLNCGSFKIRALRTLRSADILKALFWLENATLYLTHSYCGPICCHLLTNYLNHNYSYTFALLLWNFDQLMGEFCSLPASFWVSLLIWQLIVLLQSLSPPLNTMSSTFYFNLWGQIAVHNIGIVAITPTLRTITTFWKLCSRAFGYSFFVVTGSM